MGIILGILLINHMHFIHRLGGLLLAVLCGLVFLVLAKAAILKKNLRTFNICVALSILSFSAILPSALKYFTYRVDQMALKSNAESMIDDIETFIRTNNKLPDEDSGLQGLEFCTAEEFNSFREGVSILVNENNQTYSICYWKGFWVQMRFDSYTREWKKNDFD